MGKEFPRLVPEKCLLMIPENWKKPPILESIVQKEQQLADSLTPVDDVAGRNQPIFFFIKGNRTQEIKEKGELSMQIPHDIGCHQTSINPESTGRKKA